MLIQKLKFFVMTFIFIVKAKKCKIVGVTRKGWLIRVALDDVNSFWTLNLPLDNRNPYVCFIKNNFNLQVLKQYYHSVQPNSVVDFLGLDMPTVNNMHTLPPLAASVPWREPMSCNLLERRKKTILAENLLVSNKVDPKDFSWQIVGPCSQRKIQIEARRIQALYESIKSHGYRSSLSILNCDFLVSGSKSRIYFTNGQHRVAILAALGYTEITFCVRSIVLAKHAKHWPSVLSGCLEEKYAIAVFDNIIKGVIPDYLTVWFGARVGDYINE
jgi:hypothetical protein